MILFGGLLIGIVILLCVLLSVVVTSLLVMDLPVTEDVGEENITIENVTNIEESYEWSVGQQTIDLSQTTIPAGETQVNADLGAGELIVIVPPNVPVEVNWDVGIGNASIFGDDHYGLGVEDTDTDPGYAESEQRLRINVSVGVGSIVVRHE